MKKIVYVSSAPLTKSLIERLYVDVLYDSEIEVEFWDITGIYHLKYEGFEAPYIISIDTILDLKGKIKALDKENTLVNIQMGYQYKYLKIYRLLNDFKTSHFIIGTFPTYAKSTKKNINDKLKKIFSKRFFEKLVETAYKKLSIVKEFDYIFSSDSSSIERFPNSKVFNINHIDYENSLKYEGTSFYDENYVVFLDQNIAKHPDFNQINIEHIDYEKYVTQLKKLFSYIEEGFNYKVIIALHPTSEKYDFWDEKYQVKSKSVELVKDSQFVISHFSTSIFMSFIFEKPMVLTYNQEMIEKIPSVENVLKGFEKDYDSLLVSLDEKLTFDIPKVSIEKYESFIYRYCTSRDTKDKLANNYLIEYINSI